MPSPIGHALAGVTAAWTADLVPGNRAWRIAPRSASCFQRTGGGLTLTCAVLAAAPDLDLLFNSHRTMTHSVGAVIFVALVAAAMATNRARPIVRVTLMCAAAYLTHLLLDWLGADSTPPYGIQALWPFTHAWYISNLDIFRQTVRRAFLTAPSLRQNAFAVAQEIAILGPVALGVWLVREKALARLSTQLSSSDHPTK